MTEKKDIVTAALVTKDGQIFFARGFGAEGEKQGKILFNTAAIGYQEIITNPLYKGAIMTFTFPCIGNVGINDGDSLADAPQVAGVIVRNYPTPASNFRAKEELVDYMKKHKVIGLCELDTRALTKKIRNTRGVLYGIIAYDEKGLDVQALKQKAMMMKVE